MAGEPNKDKTLLEQSLHNSDERLHAVMQSVVDALIIIDEAGTVREFNPAAETMFGYDAHEVVGHNVRMLMPAPHRQAHDDYLKSYRDTGIAKIIGIGREVEGRCKDGTMRPLHLSVGEMRWGEQRYFIGTIRDLSRQKATDAALAGAQRMEALGQLTGGVAHDFNNLLAVIMMDLEMIEQMSADAPEILELAREAREVAKTGAALNERLLAFSRRQPLAPEITDLNAFVDHVVALLRRTLGEAIEIEAVGASDLWSVSVDRAGLEAALVNLAVNARDAMPAGGRLTVETRNVVLSAGEVQALAETAPGDYALLRVSDTGVGMAADVLARAFEPFFTTKGAGAGTGLGLSMVYGFAKQSGGHASIATVIGAGTQVSLYLPRATGHARVRTISPAAPPVRGGSERILLVEDHDRLRARALQALSTLGYRVHAVEGTETALAWLAQSGPIDLLFTDVVLKGSCNGVELAERVRAMDPGVKVLLTTGHADNALIRQALAGDAGILRKPYTRDDLARSLRGLLDK